MIIAVYGASSRLGHRFIEAAAAAGHVLRLHYRAKPDEQVPEHATVIVGSLSDPTAVREVLRGADAVVVFFGHRDEARVPYLAAATALIVRTMKTLAQSRLVVVTGVEVGEHNGNIGPVQRLKTLFTRRVAPDGIMEDRDEQERLVRASQLAGWTVIKPGRLTEASGTGAVAMEPAVAMGAGSHVSRGALARAVLQELESPQFAQQAVYIRER